MHPRTNNKSLESPRVGIQATQLVSDQLGELPISSRAVLPEPHGRRPLHGPRCLPERADLLPSGDLLPYPAAVLGQLPLPDPEGLQTHCLLPPRTHHGQFF